MVSGKVIEPLLSHGSRRYWELWRSEEAVARREECGVSIRDRYWSDCADGSADSSCQLLKSLNQIALLPCCLTVWSQIGQFVHEGDSVLDAVQKTLGQLEGTWGLAILDCQQPNQIITAANGSPILIGTVALVAGWLQFLKLTHLRCW